MQSFFVDGFRGPTILLALLSAMICGTANAAAEPSPEAAIHAAIDAYTTAFNKGDAEALAAVWSPTGEWITEDGARIKGRDAILSWARAKFAAGHDSQLRVVDPTIRFPTSDVAVEDGTAIVTAADGSTSETSYTAVHLRRDGKWLLENVRETAVANGASPKNPLDGLAWMIGDWVDASDKGTVETKVEWSMNRRFLVFHFHVSAPGAESHFGSQVIGYDAARGEIRSWLFDADGTIGEGVWTHDGRQWVVKSMQSLADGTRASSTNIYLPRDSNSYVWKSIGRKVGNHFLPNVGDVVVVRKGTTSPSATATEKQPEVKP